jgi:hypothetical protein
VDVRKVRLEAEMVYRSADEALKRRRDELIEARRREIQALPTEVIAVYVRRRARIAAGGAGVACALVLGVSAAARRDGLTTILQLSWLGMALVYILGWVAARRAARCQLDRAFAPTDDPGSDVLRLESLTPRDVIGALTERIEWRSIALPMTALALFVPLSLHYAVATLLRARVPDGRDFDDWISLSLLLVGHCHVVLAVQAWKFARMLRGAPDVFSVGMIADRSGWQAWGITILSSLVAGVLVLLIVPIAGIALVLVAPTLVAATGLAFIPAMFARMGRKIRAERVALVCPGTVIV